MRDPVAGRQGVRVGPVGQRFEPAQQRRDRRRRIAQAVQAVGEPLVEESAAVLAQAVQLGYHGVGERVAHGEHADHVLGPLTVLGLRRLEVDQPAGERG